MLVVLFERRGFGDELNHLAIRIGTKVGEDTISDRIHKPNVHLSTIRPRNLSSDRGLGS